MASQIDVFHECFDQVSDPRVAGRTIHRLNSILFLVVATVIAGADGPDEIESFGGEKLDWLSKFADFEAGIPSHDTITRVLSLIKPAEFQKALLQWHSHLCELARASPGGDSPNNTGPIHVAIDGKTVRGSYTDAEKSNAIHIVSATPIGRFFVPRLTLPTGQHSTYLVCMFSVSNGDLVASRSAVRNPGNKWYHLFAKKAGICVCSFLRFWHRFCLIRVRRIRTHLTGLWLIGGESRLRTTVRGETKHESELDTERRYA